MHRFYCLKALLSPQIISINVVKPLFSYIKCSIAIVAEITTGSQKAANYVWMFAFLRKGEASGSAEEL